MCELFEVNRKLQARLNIGENTTEPAFWKINNSPIGGGRGMFATCDIEPEAIIFVDRPLLVGPRGVAGSEQMCVNCYKKDNLKPCTEGCGLPVCSDICGNAANHFKDCDLLRKWQRFPTDRWSLNLLRALTPIRSLLLADDEKTVLGFLKGHAGDQHGFEVNLLRNALDVKLDSKDEEYLKKVCEILDANAFSTLVVHGKDKTSLRGVYPLGAFMNHCCVPNTVHVFDDKLNMIVRAAKFIPKGSEMTATYSNVCWSTHVRRQHLLKTKHFMCSCPRCADPTERGTFLAALKCTNEACEGVLLPIQPLDSSTDWNCTKCGLRVPAKTIAMIHYSLVGVMANLKLDEPKRALGFLKEHLEKGIPPTHHVAMDLKWFIISNLGDYEGFLWSELSEENLQYKENLCREFLDFLNKLQSGFCTMRGLVLYELYCCLMEHYKRNAKQDWIQEANICFQEAAEILKYDATAPPEIKIINK